MKLLVATISAKQVICIVLAVVAMTAAAADRYYRYLNDEGVTVMDSRIPPKYVKNGYEVVTISGRVLEVVPPAPSPEEAEEAAARREREAELAEFDSFLVRRYSSVGDIEAAKERKLADFDASMSILRGNASGLESQIKDVQGRAADIERSGREVPEVLLENLSTLQDRLDKENQQIEQRLVKKKELEDRFDREIERFAQIKSDS